MTRVTSIDVPVCKIFGQEDFLATKSIRSIRDDAIETMVIGVNWADSSDGNTDPDKTTSATDPPQKTDNQADDTTSSCATIPMGTLSEYSSGGGGITQ